MPLITRKTITETFLERVKVTPDEVGFQYKPTYAEAGVLNIWKQVTFREYFEECKQVAFGLMALGVEPGDRVAILSNTRYEWSLSDMAILGAAGVTVPIYASSIPDDVCFIAHHSEAKIMILEDAKQLQKIVEKRLEKPDCLPHLKKIIVIEPSAIALAASHQNGSQNIITFTALKELGRREESRSPERFEDNLRNAKPEDLITICYTSGTTGVPKGAMITHDNMMSVLEDCVATVGRFVNPKGEVILSFLPFSHILGKAESMAIYSFGWRQAYVENIDKLMSNIVEVRPTVIFAVPRIFERAFNRVHSHVQGGASLKKRVFDKAFRVGRKYYQAIWAHQKPSFSETAEYAIATQLVFSKIAQRFGGRLRFAVCGGAPLPKEIGEFFQVVGIKILEGYGLTETTAPVSLNLPDDARFGVVGRPLPEVQIKIAEDGEILVNSRKVFKGYFKMPKETAEVLHGGWFHTGDIGHLDADGFLHITDRKKDLIVTSGGKNVAPQKIENLAKAYSLITQFVAHGDRRHFLTALVTLDREQVIRFATEHSILFSEYSELVKNPKILGWVQKIIDEVNRKLATYETIKKFVILPNEFGIDSGELTPSLKVRRSYINRRFKNELDSMYTSS
ncbi:long-chain fatty acid--CoA ligase [Bdellovibrionota bacterium FG-1]